MTKKMSKINYSEAFQKVSGRANRFISRFVEGKTLLNCCENSLLLYCIKFLISLLFYKNDYLPKLLLSKPFMVFYRYMSVFELLIYTVQLNFTV